MIYGNPPFHAIPGGPLSKMNKIADPTHRIDYPSMAIFNLPGMSDCPSMPTAVTIPSEAITTMRGCLDYHKDRRLTIPQLLDHEFLSPTGPCTSTSQPKCRCLRQTLHRQAPRGSPRSRWLFSFPSSRSRGISGRHHRRSRTTSSTNLQHRTLLQHHRKRTGTGCTLQTGAISLSVGV